MSKTQAEGMLRVTREMSAPTCTLTRGPGWRLRTDESHTHSNTDRLHQTGHCRVRIMWDNLATQVRVIMSKRAMHRWTWRGKASHAGHVTRWGYGVHGFFMMLQSCVRVWQVEVSFSPQNLYFQSTGHMSHPQYREQSCSWNLLVYYHINIYFKIQMSCRMCSVNILCCTQMKSLGHKN